MFLKKNNIHCFMPVITLLVLLVLTDDAPADDNIQPDSQKTDILYQRIRQIPHPPLEGLEQIVIEQLSKSNKEMKTILGNTEASRLNKALAYGNLGHLYHTYQFMEAAEACYGNAALYQPNVYRWNYCLAYVLQEKGDYTKALHYYKIAQSINVTPDLVYLVNIRLGECYLSLNEVEKAGMVYDLAYKINPGGPAILSRMGELELKNKQYDKAIFYLEEALKREPAANKLYYPLAMAYRNKGNLDTAKKHLKRRGMVGVQPPDPLKKKLDSLVEGYRVNLLAGKRAFSANRYDEARVSFQKAIKADPNNPAAHINLGSTYVSLNNYQKALESYETANALAPDNMTAHFNIGSLCLFNGNLDKAVTHFNIYIEKHPEDAEARIKLANALNYNGEIQTAFDHYVAALKSKPDLTEGWVALSLLLTNNNQHREALNVLREAHTKLPNDKVIRQNLARLFGSSPILSLRDGNKALELVLPMFEHNKNYETAKTIAIAYSEIGQCDKAIEWISVSTDLAGKTYQQETVMEILNRNLDFFKTNIPCRLPGK